MVLPTAEECAQIRKAFTEQLAGLGKPVAPAPQAYGIGGSVRAVSKMAAALAGRGKALKQLSPNDIDAMFDLLEREPSQFAHLAVKAVPDRLHSMMPGAIILREALRAAGAETLTLCKYGVREELPGRTGAWGSKKNWHSAIRRTKKRILWHQKNEFGIR